MDTIFTLEKLYAAYRACRKGKMRTVNALQFELDRERNLMTLLGELRAGTYRMSRHLCFIIEKPVPREIFAADFRDRIVHHLLCNELVPLFDADFVARSYANRKGKGTHKAVARLRKDVQDIRRRTGSGYYLKLDVESFFRSIDRSILFALVEKKLRVHAGPRSGGGAIQGWHQDVLWLAHLIIFSDPTTNYVFKGDITKRSLIPAHKSLFSANGTGLPIGNLTSQFFANVYLNELDHFVTRTCKEERYVRYVDDFVIISEDAERLRSLIGTIGRFLDDRLRLRLHPGKIQLQDVRKGVDFLGYFARPSHMLVRQKVVKRLKRRLRGMEDACEAVPVLNSYYGHFKHARTNRLRRHVYEEHLGSMKPLLEPRGAFDSFRLRPRP